MVTSQRLVRARIFEYAVVSVAVFAGLVGPYEMTPLKAILAALSTAFLFFVLFLFGLLALGLQYGLLRLGLKSPLLLSMAPALLFLGEGAWIALSWSNPVPRQDVMLALVIAAAVGVFGANFLAFHRRDLA